MRAPYRPPGLGVHPADLGEYLLVAARPRAGWAMAGGVVGARGDLAAVLGQHPADRLDPEPATMSVDERGHHGSRGSSSRAKRLDAANRISLARLNSRFSACNLLIVAASLVVVPGA